MNLSSSLEKLELTIEEAKRSFDPLRSAAVLVSDGSGRRPDSGKSYTSLGSLRIAATFFELKAVLHTSATARTAPLSYSRSSTTRLCISSGGLVFRKRATCSKLLMSSSNGITRS